MEKSTSKPGNDAVDNATGAVQRGVDSAGSALHSGIDKVADPARDTVDCVSTAAHETVDKLTSGASDLSSRISDQARCMADAPREALDCSKSWVQDKPLEAVGLALALGFIVGRLSAR